MSKRDKLRAKTIGSEQKFKSQVVDIGDGETVKVRSPTVEERALIVSSSGQVDPKSGEMKPDLARLQVNSVIALAVDPESGEKLFEEADRATMMNAPAGGWFDKLAEVAVSMINVDLSDAKNG